MTWTAPPITRRPEPTTGGERKLLEDWLDYHRDTLLLKCAGLTGDQLARRTAEPSAMSLLGLVRHLAEVERSWFRRRLAGEDVGYLYVSDDDEDADFDRLDPARAEADMAALAAEVAAARAVAAGRSLDDTFEHVTGTLTLRWVYLHLIEEYARHNGHADLLRERIDGATGD